MEPGEGYVCMRVGAMAEGYTTGDACCVACFSCAVCNLMSILRLGFLLTDRG